MGDFSEAFKDAYPPYEQRYTWDGALGQYTGFGQVVAAPLAVFLDIDLEHVAVGGRHLLLSHGNVVRVAENANALRAAFVARDVPCVGLVVLEFPLGAHAAEIVNWCMEHTGAVHPDMQEPIQAALAPGTESK